MNGSIRKRYKGPCEITIELARDAHGNRRRKRVNVKGAKAQAQQKQRGILSLSDKGIPVTAQKITFGQWLAKWMHDYVVNRRQKTIERYGGLIGRHIAPHICNSN